MTKKEQEMIQIPRTWLEGLVRKAEAIKPYDKARERQAIEALSILVGYASSAKTILELNKPA